MNNEKLNSFVQTFEEYRSSSRYKARKVQTCFASIGRSIIQETLANSSLTNEMLTGLIQMLKFECSDEVLRKYLNINIASEKTRKEILNSYAVCGNTGYTRAGKTGVSTLTQSQINAVQQFLSAAFQTKEIEEAVKLVEQFESLNVPEIKSGVYSPWLHYINPSLFPILNNTYDEFLKWLEIEKSYSICLTEFNKLKLLINETSYAMLDSFAHTFEAATLKGDTKSDNPIFFNSYDFYCLEKYAGKVKVKSNEDHEHTYRELRWTYDKVEHWARTVQSQLFPNGKVELLKKPTNQANYFEKYQWARIYPDQNDPTSLAFTVSIDIGKEFHVKIDTVWLGADDHNREKYETIRGDYRNSFIVRILPATDIFALGWDGLVKATTEILSELLPAFHSLQFELGLVTKDPSTLNNSQMNNPLNKILYGPPGTGKTYTSIREAVKIADREFYNRHQNSGEAGDKEIRDRFNELLIKDFNAAQGQIAFCTFHQSLSYEDFVEGIKPLDPEQHGGNVAYKVTDGIFKKISRLAEDRSFDKMFDYVFSPLKNGYVSKLEFKTKINVRFNVTRHSTEKGVYKITSTNGEEYTNNLEKESVRRFYETGDETPVGGIDSYRVGIAIYLKKITIPHVLIIDEINRGNVSQIFGELITLIEKDKRTGEKESLEVVLPYSQKAFSVPPNLYILGTMNTADRSVEALDTALRRRFAFEELKSKPEILAQTIGGIALNNILTSINKRIEVLLDRDHTIGHSFFYNLENNDEVGLRNVFRDSIIPLLKEYFYGDYGKIALVLGKGFVDVVNKPAAIKFAIENRDYEGASDFTSPKYLVKEITPEFNIIEALTQLDPQVTPVTTPTLN